MLFPLLVEFTRKNEWLVALVIGFVVVVVIFALILIIGIPGLDVVNVTMALILIVSGFALHVVGGDSDPPDNLESFDESQALRYAWFHSAWHVLIMISIYYILDLKYGYSRVSRFINSNIKIIGYSFWEEIGDDDEEEVITRAEKKTLLTLDIS